MRVVMNGNKRIIEVDENEKIGNITELTHALNDADKRANEIKYQREPTYQFKEGEEVRIGNIFKSVIYLVLNNSRQYIVKEYNKKRDSEQLEERIRAVDWYDIRPLNYGNTSLTKNKDLRLNFYSSDIDALLLKYHGRGIDMNPEYQREYIWTDDDKQKLLQSVFNNIDIGKFVLVHNDNNKWQKSGFAYDILDGKQRLTTLIDFYENRISYKGYYYNDLSKEDRFTFLNHPLSVAEVDNANDKTILNYFIMLNTTGKSMDENNIKRAIELSYIK